MDEKAIEKIKRILADSPELHVLETEYPAPKFRDDSSDIEVIALRSKSGEEIFFQASARDYQEYVIAVDDALPQWYMRDLDKRGEKWRPTWTIIT